MLREVGNTKVPGLHMYGVASHLRSMNVLAWDMRYPKGTSCHVSCDGAQRYCVSPLPGP